LGSYCTGSRMAKSVVPIPKYFRVVPVDLVPNPIITIKGLGEVITAGILAEIVDVLHRPSASAGKNAIPVGSVPCCLCSAHQRMIDYSIVKVHLDNLPHVFA
jgi:hypothetical protein